jgi:hypothetical protein
MILLSTVVVLDPQTEQRLAAEAQAIFEDDMRARAKATESTIVGEPLLSVLHRLRLAEWWRCQKESVL